MSLILYKNNTLISETNWFNKKIQSGNYIIFRILHKLYK